MQIHSYEKYGGIGYPSYQHSFTALFIILCGRYIKNKNMRMITYINSISSFLSHNPFIANNMPVIQRFSQYIDKVSIFKPIYLTPLLLDEPREKTFLFYYFIHSMIKALFGTNNQKYVFGVLYLIYTLYKNNRFTREMIFFIILSILSKKYEKTSIYAHSLWHIFSGITNMLVCNGLCK